MSLGNQHPRPYTEEMVRELEPDQVGIYGLLSDIKWVYVGQGDIRDRLLRHLSGDNPCISRWKPTHFIYEMVDDPEAAEEQEIEALDPDCNKTKG